MVLGVDPDEWLNSNQMEEPRTWSTLTCALRIYTNGQRRKASKRPLARGHQTTNSAQRFSTTLPKLERSGWRSDHKEQPLLRARHVFQDRRCLLRFGPKYLNKSSKVGRSQVLGGHVFDRIKTDGNLLL